MANPFTVDVPSNTVRLDAKRQGEVRFTVFNASGRPLRGHGKLVADPPEAAAWLELDGDAERSFAIAGTEAYVVKVRVPADAAAGSYTFRLDVYDEDDPDRSYVKGPGVTFEVAELPPPPPRRFPWWLVAVAAVVLAVVATIIFWPRPPATVTIPPTRSLTVDEAYRNLVGLELRPVLEARFDSLAAGSVVGTEPSEGETVDRNAEVTLVVSLGPDNTPPSCQPWPRCILQRPGIELPFERFESIEVDGGLRFELDDQLRDRIRDNILAPP